ncbi:hypothetical protein [Alloacidobacterium sp.]|uniref:hypothetical protein n=1 Tax=Alloacidobacterium sp. TaxID=2951999 RepID=UPI002D53C4A1|nr:hypothetical protein [Alloacidobacterium sp.]HYK37531.1 hypothetical protein [Alloacidobacterium sp.]
MTLLDAPTYNAARAKRNRNIIIAVIAVIVLIGFTGVLGFVSGHGWFFSTIPSEHRVNKFLAAVEAQDFTRAYSLWNNDSDWQKHPDQYKVYDFNQFQKDWGSASDYGVIRSHKIVITKAVGNGVVMGVDINGGKTPLFLRVDDKTKQIGFSPIELYVGP